MNVADISERVARTNVEMFHGNMEIVRQFWQSAADLSPSLAIRSSERWFDQWERLLRSRTPQEFAALQTDAMCEQLVGVIEGTQRVAQISLKTPDEATRKLKENAERMRFHAPSPTVHRRELGHSEVRRQCLQATQSGHFGQHF